jgi:hypothetical protein
MTAALHAKLTRTYTGAPLAIVDGLPGGVGAELTPRQLRDLAAALVQIAADLEARPAARRHSMSERKDYPLQA